MVLRAPDKRLARVITIAGSAVYLQEGVNQVKHLAQVVETWALAKQFEEET
jgi:hypothetical protein